MITIMRPDIHLPHMGFISGCFSGHCLFNALENTLYFVNLLLKVIGWF